MAARNPARAGLVVLGFDQSPRLFFLSASAVHAHEVPAPMQLLPLEREDEVPLLVTLVRVVLRNPAPTIPDHPRAAAVLSLRNRAFECVVLDRVVFHVDREAFLARNEARTTGDRPALHYAVEFESQGVI